MYPRQLFTGCAGGTHLVSYIRTFFNNEVDWSTLYVSLPQMDRLDERNVPTELFIETLRLMQKVCEKEWDALDEFNTS